MDVKFESSLLYDMLGANLEKKYKLLTELEWDKITNSDKDEFLKAIYPVLRNQTFRFLRDINDENKYLAKKMFHQFYEFKKKIKDRETNAHIKVLFVRWLEAERDNDFSGLPEQPVEELAVKKDAKLLNESSCNEATNYMYTLPMWLEQKVTVELWPLPPNLVKSFDDKQEKAVETAQNILKLPEMYIGLEYLSVTEACVNNEKVQNPCGISKLIETSKQWAKAFSNMNSTLKKIQYHLGNLTKNVHQNFSGSEMRETLEQCVIIARDVENELKNAFENFQGLKHTCEVVESVESSPYYEEDEEQDEGKNITIFEEVVNDCIDVLSLSAKLDSSKLAITFNTEQQRNSKAVMNKKEIDDDLYLLKQNPSQNFFKLFDKAREKFTTVQKYWSVMTKFLQSLKDIVPDAEIKLNEPQPDREHEFFLYRIRNAHFFAFLINQAIRIDIKITEKHILPLMQKPSNVKQSLMETRKRAILTCKTVKATMEGTKNVYDHFVKNGFKNQTSIKAS